jgi:hypothetical protein
MTHPLATSLRNGSHVPNERIAQELEDLTSQLERANTLLQDVEKRVKNCHTRGMIEGYAVIRKEDALKAVLAKLE